MFIKRGIGRKRFRGVALALACATVFSAQLSTEVQANTDKAIFLQTPAAEHFDNAMALVQAQSYADALSLFRRIQAYYPGFEKLSAVQTRIAVLQEARDAPNEIGFYLDALDKRDAGEADAALTVLDTVLTQYPDSTLTDDVLYLKAYVQTMDRYDFNAALQILAQLQQQYPESSYEDSADYLEAIALEQSGRTEEAKLALEDLRERHTAFSLPFGYSWPTGNVLSRYWYDRADRRLDIIHQSDENASRLRSRQSLDTGELTVGVNVDGVDLEFKLASSPLTRTTAWRDGQLQDRSPPAAGVFVGSVIGDEQSWVRAVIVNDTISGVAHAFGRTYTMQTGTLIGTLDYYKPRSARERSADNPDAVSTDAKVGRDALVPPPDLGAALGGSSSVPTSHSDLRVVPISIVIDAEFDRYHGGEGLVVALNQLNVADGIYRQFGLALAIDEVQIFGDDDHNPMLNTPSTLESYLVDFRSYRQGQRTLFSDSALTYLFTGKQRTDKTLGLAWIDTLCRADGYDVGITTPSAIGDVLLTHELGHSLGSLHDSDTSCNQDATKIMWPHISTNTQVVFSDCSSSAVSGARSKSCLVNTVDLSLDATGASNGVEFLLGNLDTGVSVDAELIIETSSAGVLNLPAGCHSVSPTSAKCAIDTLAAGEQRRLLFSTETVANDALVTGEIVPLATTDFNLANNKVTYSIAQQTTSTDHLILASSDSTQGASTAERGAASGSGSGSVSKSGLLMLSLMQLIGALKIARSTSSLN